MLIGIIAVFCILCIYFIYVIYRDMHRMTVTTYEIADARIKQDATFVVLSDLHNQSYGKDNEKLIAAVRELHPDFIVSLGDLYTSKKGSGFDNAVALLKGLADEFPIYLSTGNHELKTRVLPDAFEGMYEAYCKELDAISLHHIINDTIELPTYNIRLFFLEIARSYYRHFRLKKMDDSYIAELLQEETGRNEQAFSILLAHNPLYFDKYAAWGADLTISGHMHGGIVRLPFVGGCASPMIRLFPKYDFGLFRFDALRKSVRKVGVKMPDGTIRDPSKTHAPRLILGCGLGTHTLPIRMWNPGEIVVVHLKAEKQPS